MLLREGKASRTERRDVDQIDTGVDSLERGLRDRPDLRIGVMKTGQVKQGDSRREDPVGHADIDVCDSLLVLWILLLRHVWSEKTGRRGSYLLRAITEMDCRGVFLSTADRHNDCCCRELQDRAYVPMEEPV